LIIFLFKVPFFSIFTNDKLLNLSKTAKIKEYNVGDVIIREGEIGNTFHILASGEVGVYINSGHQTEVIS
jgi:CRP-like cAMP-binding protein